jgi:small-conductance mechanosensitive channel
MVNLELVPFQMKRLFLQVIQLLKDEFQADAMEAVAITAGFAVLFGGLLLLQKYVSNNIQNQRIKIIVSLAAPILFLIAAHFAFQENPKSSFLLILFYLAVFWLAWDIIKQTLDYFGIKKRKILVLSLMMIMGAMVLIIFHGLVELKAPELASQYTSTLNLLEILIKIFIASAIAIYIRLLLPGIIERIKDRIPFDIKQKRLASRINNFIFILFITLSVLWITGVVEFGLKFLIGITVLVILMSIHAYVSYRIEWVADHIFSARDWEESEIRNIRKHLKRTSFWIVVIFFIKIGRHTFGLSHFLDGMKNISVIQIRDLNLSLFNLVWGIVLFALSFSLLFLMAKYLNMLATKYSDNPTTGKSIEALIRNLGFLIILVLFGYTIGLTWGLLIPIAGAIGIGVGFGLQTIINNYISGFVLLVTDKIRIGDVIEVPGNAGRVLGITTDTIFGWIKSIDMFSTIVVTNDNIDVSIPNSELITNKIINYTHSSNYIRMRISFGVSYGADVEVVEKCAREVILGLDYVVQERKNDVWFSGYGESSLDFIALCWVTLDMGFPPQKIQSEFLYRLWFKLKENNVEIPFPQRDVWFKTPLKIETDVPVKPDSK